MTNPGVIDDVDAAIQFLIKPYNQKDPDLQQREVQDLFTMFS